MGGTNMTEELSNVIDELVKDAQVGISKAEWQEGDHPGELVKQYFLGVVRLLCPCGQIGHAPSPPDEEWVPQECYDFWTKLESDLSNFGIGLDSGEGDPCDIFATKQGEGEIEE